MDIRQLSQAMMRLRLQIEQAAAEGVAEAAVMVAEEAKSWIGHKHPNWPELAESTANRKTTGYDAPLYEEGHLKESIQVAQVGLTAEIGSDDPKAPTHEHGGVTPNGFVVPARPFLHPALMSKANEIRTLIEQKVEAAIQRK